MSKKIKAIVSATEDEVAVSLQQGNLLVGFSLPHGDAVTLAEQMAKAVLPLLWLAGMPFAVLLAIYVFGDDED